MNAKYWAQWWDLGTGGWRVTNDLLLPNLSSSFILQVICFFCSCKIFSANTIQNATYVGHTFETATLARIWLSWFLPHILLLTHIDSTKYLLWSSHTHTHTPAPPACLSALELPSPYLHRAVSLSLLKSPLLFDWRAWLSWFTTSKVTPIKRNRNVWKSPPALSVHSSLGNLRQLHVFLMTFSCSENV